MNEKDMKELMDKNSIFLILLGYGSSIIFQLQNALQDNAPIGENIMIQIDWYKSVIENIIYKNILPEKMP